jgi:hypothetical protein
MQQTIQTKWNIFLQTLVQLIVTAKGYVVPMVGIVYVVYFNFFTQINCDVLHAVNATTVASPHFNVIGRTLLIKNTVTVHLFINRRSASGFKPTSSFHAEDISAILKVTFSFNLKAMLVVFLSAALLCRCRLTLVVNSSQNHFHFFKL